MSYRPKTTVTPDKNATPLVDHDAKVVPIGSYPTVAMDLIAILKKYYIPSPKLSPAQLIELTERVVAIPGGTLPPPQKEKETFPKEWANYMSHVDRSPGFRVFREKRKQLTMNTLIRYIRGYSLPERWCDYRPLEEEKRVFQPKDWS